MPSLAQGTAATSSTLASRPEQPSRPATEPRSQPAVEQDHAPASVKDSKDSAN